MAEEGISGALFLGLDSVTEPQQKPSCQSGAEASWVVLLFIAMLNHS